MPETPEPPEECANCGAPIPRGAKSCPECGADERTGWRENSIYDGLELPEGAFDADDQPDTAGTPPPRINGIAWYWWLVAVVLILLAVAGHWLF